MFFSKLKKPSTFFKYLLSYILIFTVLVSAFFLILRVQLTGVYSSQQAERIRAQISAVSAQLNEEFQSLLQVDSEISGNPELRSSTLYPENKYLRVAYEELTKFDATSSLISNIILHSHSNGQSLSLHDYIVSYDDGIFTLLANGKTLVFDATPFLASNSNQLIWLQGEVSAIFLYFPKLSSLDRLIFFYELDTRVLQSQIRSLVSDEVPAVALLDGNGNVITGEGISGYAGDPALADPSTGIRTLSNGDELFLSEPLSSGLYLAAVVSEDYLPRQVNGAFLGSFASLLGLSVLGIVLVYVAMLFTYRPLQRFVKSLGHEPRRNRRYLDLLSENYSELSSQKIQLEQTLAQYRNSLAQYRLRESAAQEYPHQELNSFAQFLEENRFAEATTLLEGMLNRFDQGSVRTDYFLGCILLDTLTLITNSMSKAHIEFTTYSETFMEAVRLCRNVPKIENFNTLNQLIHKLLFFYEKETLSRLLHITPLRQIVQENFCNPDFSISVIARACHVSDSRMSTLFKEEMGIGFTDCVWQYRLEKARELLTATDLPVDEISRQIGYLTPNSFRRKFKQETGLTPSQFRNQFSPTEQ